MAKKPVAAAPTIDITPVATAVENGLAELSKIGGFVSITNNNDFREALAVLGEIKKRKDALQAAVEPVESAVKSLSSAVSSMTKKFRAKYDEMEGEYRRECREYLESIDKEDWPEGGRLQGGQWVVTVDDQQAMLEHLVSDRKLWYLLSINQQALKALASAQTTAFSMPGCTAKQSQSMVLGKDSD
jgi:hypothetical protein